MENTLLEFKPGAKEHVKKICNLERQDKMDQAVEILQEWLKRQSHFTKKEYDRKYLESTLLDTKGSIEKAKTKLEKRCIFRTMFPHFFEINDFNQMFEEFIANTIAGFPLPKLTKDHYRVFLLKGYENEYFKRIQFLTYIKLAFIINEYLKLNDCCAGYIYIIDCTEVSMWYVISLIKPQEFKQFATYYLDIQGMRLKKLIFISPSPIVEQLIKLIKPLMSKKVGERIEVYKDMEEVIDKVVPKEMMPVEFGGTDIRINYVQENWMKILGSREFMNYYKEMGNAQVDEDFKKQVKNNYIEMAGSFVSLEID